MENLEIPERVKKYIQLDESGCWLWIGSKTRAGYGGFLRTIEGKNKYFYAHRFIYEIANGPIVNGLFCCHHCDVRNCVNPEHIFLGTTQDNTRDMMAKGRYKPCKVIADETKDAIRSDYATGKFKQFELEKAYDVSSPTIRRILEGYPGSWYNRKYKPEFIQEIRDLYHNNNYTHAEIGEMYGLSFDIVGRIIRGRR
jgi:hypothetical protein